MGHTENDKLYAEFMDTLETVNVCPYCGHPKEEGDPCCHEVHDEIMWDNGDEYISEDDLEAYFKKWLLQRGDS